MSDSFFELERDTAPRWLRGVFGEALHIAWGLVKDGIASGAKVAVKSRFINTAPPDALLRLIDDFNLAGKYRETEAQTKTRLRGAWASWSKAGTVAGVLASINSLGYPNAKVHERTQAGRWWTYRIVVRSPFPFNEAMIAIAPLWGDPIALFGAFDFAGVPFVSEPARIAAAARKWAPAHAVLEGVTFQLAGPYWNEFVWNDGSTWSGLEETF